MQDRFCPVPFSHFRVSTVGDVSLCSPSRLKIPVVGNMLKDGIEAVWNSERAQEFRASILDGSFRHCMAEHCPALQKGSLPKRAGIKDPYLRAVIDEGRTVLDRGPTEVNLHYDKTCNLKCPSCRPNIIGLKGEGLQRAFTLRDRILDSDILDDVRLIIICGYGEVFASAVHLGFLRGITSTRYPKLRIKLLTNGLLLTRKMWDSFANAHDMVQEISVSVDAATPETYAINRGGDFTKLLANLEMISLLRRKQRIGRFTMNFVVQDNNFSEMKAFAELGRDLGCDSVLFQKVFDSTGAMMSDFRARAVHLPDHPRHGELRALLTDPIFRDPVVDLYTVSGVALA